MNGLRVSVTLDFLDSDLNVRAGFLPLLDGVSVMIRKGGKQRSTLK